MINETRDLYFISSGGRSRLISRNVKIDTALKIIKEFLDYHNYKSYYTRSWDDESGRWFDVGSWTEFFLWGMWSTTEEEEDECLKERLKDIRE